MHASTKQPGMGREHWRENRHQGPNHSWQRTQGTRSDGRATWRPTLGLPNRRATHTAGSPYGHRIHPIKKTRKMHQGQDIPCKRFEPIYAVARGEVVVVKRSSSAGKYIQIKHESSDGKDVRTSYMHLSIRRPRVGRTVRKGKMIGRCGNTGMSTDRIYTSKSK